MNFCVAILTLKMKENKQYFWHIMLYYFRKGKMQLKHTHTHTKIRATYREGAVTDRCIKSGLQRFRLEISRWTMPHVQVDQLKLIALKLKH